MHAAGGQGDEHVPLLHGFLIQNFALVHHAYAETGQVVFVLGVEAGHLGGLTAHQRAARLHAALGHAAHDLRHALGHVLAHSHVVQKELGLCAAADDVVDAHGHAVDAHGVMLVHQKGQLELGAHAVGAADQHRALDARHVQLKQATEAADALQHAGNHGAGHVLLHQLNGAVAGGDVHPRGLVACAFALHRFPSSVFWRSVRLRSNLSLAVSRGGSTG